MFWSSTTVYWLLCSLFSYFHMANKEGVLAKIAERFARHDVCTLILEVRGVCLRERYESSVVVGTKVFCRLEVNSHAKLGHCIVVHRADDGGLAGRAAAEQGDLLVPFLRGGQFFLYHWYRRFSCVLVLPSINRSMRLFEACLCLSLSCALSLSLSLSLPVSLSRLSLPFSRYFVSFFVSPVAFSSRSAIPVVNCRKARGTLFK